MVLNRRGVALLIVLLVTALLLASVFEFAFATRVTMNSAVNFRDSQRAYFLARSGVHVFAKYKDLRDSLPQGEWQVVPIISSGDTELRIKWEDEQGKINIAMIRTGSPNYGWMNNLFTQKGIDQNILDTISGNPPMTFLLPTQLHWVMNDKDFAKIEPFVTTVNPQAPDYHININTASPEVFEAMGIQQPDVIVSARETAKFQAISDLINNNLIAANTYNAIMGNLTVTSNIYKVYSYATVGDYTKQVIAIIQINPYNVLYWRAL